MNKQIENIYLLSLISIPIMVYIINYLKPNWIYIIDNKGEIVLCEKLLYSYSLLFSLILLFILLILRNISSDNVTNNVYTNSKEFNNIQKKLTSNCSGTKIQTEKILERDVKLNVDKDNNSFFPTFYYD